LQPMS